MLVTLASCSSGSSSSSPGITMELNAQVMPAVPGSVNTTVPGEKTFTNNAGDTITLTRAWLTISSTEIVTDCSGITFSAMLDGVLGLLVPAAQAHTNTTPTSTGIPYVVDLMANDGTSVSLGALNPPAGDYCGARYDMTAADDDANNLPTAVDMVGKTLHIEGSYTLAGNAGSGSFTVSTGATLIQRDLLYPAIVSLSASSLNGSGSVSIQYDTWFNGIDMAKLAAGDSSQVNQALINITDSLHQ